MTRKEYQPELLKKSAAFDQALQESLRLSGLFRSTEEGAKKEQIRQQMLAAVTAQQKAQAEYKAAQAAMKSLPWA